MNDLDHIVRVCRHAASSGNTGPLSTGESLAAALVLNRADWLAALGYTIPEALSRIGAEWAALLSDAEKTIADDDRVRDVVAEGIEMATIRPTPEANAPHAPALEYEARLVTCGESPGYRDMTLTVDLREIDGKSDGDRLNAQVSFNAEDSETIALHIIGVHSRAWSRSPGPLDLKDGERFPPWWLPADE